MSTAQCDFADEPFFDPEGASGYWTRFATLLGISTVIATIGLYRKAISVNLLSVIGQSSSA